MEYKGISGVVYYLEDQPMAGGGEGNVYRINGRDNQVAKIFRPDLRNSKREDKLKLMIKTKLTDEQLTQVTWPQDVIYDMNGFVGYIMPKLHNTDPLISIYGDGNDNKYDIRYRVLAAKNLCVALKAIHDNGQVCGDLNPQNICINLNKSDKVNGFHVTLVDSDSYHIRSGEEIHRCEVGLADYIAPELQRKLAGGFSLVEVSLPTYTRETDLFALAVHIFSLLMNGCHPFACTKEHSTKVIGGLDQMKEGTVKPSVVAPRTLDNISVGFFPFYEKREGLTIPAYAPEFESLPENIRELFIRTFVEGHSRPEKRADEMEWIEALTQVEYVYKECKIGDGKTEKHYFFAHNKHCPICAVNKKIVAVMGEQKAKEEAEKQEEEYQVPDNPVLAWLYNLINTDNPLQIAPVVAMVLFGVSLIFGQFSASPLMWVLIMLMTLVGAGLMLFGEGFVSGTILAVMSLFVVLTTYTSFGGGAMAPSFFTRNNIFIVVLVLGALMLTVKKLDLDFMYGFWFAPGGVALILFFVDAILIKGAYSEQDIKFAGILAVAGCFVLGYWAFRTQKELEDRQ